MKKIFSQFFVAVTGMLLMTLASANSLPLFTFEPLTATTLSVSPSSTFTVKYNIINQSPRSTFTLFLKFLDPGVVQIPSPGYCSSPFILPPKGSCILNLLVLGSSLTSNLYGGPAICTWNNPNQCYQSTTPLNITKVTNSNFTIGGSTFGLQGTLVLQNSDGEVITLTADSAFTFPQALPTGTTYSVTVQSQPATQTCTVTNGNGIITNQNINNIIVNCSSNTHTVGGTIAGLGAGKIVELLNNGTDPLLRNVNGPFTFATALAQGSNYSVTVGVQPPGQFCSVVNGSGVVGTTDITNVQVTCAVQTFTVGGNLTGLVIGNTVRLQNNGTDSLTLNSNGGFTFPTPLANLSPYNVTVLSQPAGQTCNVINGIGIITNSNVNNVLVQCT